MKNPNAKVQGHLKNRLFQLAYSFGWNAEGTLNEMKRLISRMDHNGQIYDPESIDINYVQEKMAEQRATFLLDDADDDTKHALQAVAYFAWRNAIPAKVLSKWFSRQFSSKEYQKASLARLQARVADLEAILKQKGVAVWDNAG